MVFSGKGDPSPKIPSVWKQKNLQTTHIILLGKSGHTEYNTKQHKERRRLEKINQLPTRRTYTLITRMR